MGLTLCTYAVTRGIIFSLGLPFFMAYTKILSYGSTYPIILMGVTTSYGTLGQGWMLVTLGLLSCRRYRMGKPEIKHRFTQGWLHRVLVELSVCDCYFKRG